MSKNRTTNIEYKLEINIDPGLQDVIDPFYLEHEILYALDYEARQKYGYGDQFGLNITVTLTEVKRNTP